MFASIYESYLSSALDAGGWSQTTYLITSIGSLVLALSLWGLTRAMIYETWARWVSYVFLTFSIQYGLFFVDGFFDHIHDYSFSKNIIHWLSPLNNIFLLLAARHLRNYQVKDLSKPIIVLFLGIALFAVFSEMILSHLPWHRMPEAIFSAYCIYRFGFAMARDILGSTNNKYIYTFYVCFSLTYVFASLLRGLHPIITTIQMGSPEGGALVTGILDSYLALFALPLKVLLFFGALAILIRSLFILMPNDSSLKNVIDGSDEYLDEKGIGGLLRALAKSARADHIGLATNIPGQEKNQIFWWAWFKEEVNNRIADGPACSIEIEKDQKYPIVDPHPTPDGSPVGDVLASGCLSACPDTDKYKVSYSSYFKSTKSFIVIPIRYNGSTIGALNFEWSRKRGYSATAIRRLEQLAEYVAPTIHAKRKSYALRSVADGLMKVNRSTQQATKRRVQAFCKVICDVFELHALSIELKIGFKNHRVDYINPSYKNYVETIINTSSEIAFDAELPQGWDLHSMTDPLMAQEEAELGTITLVLPLRNEAKSHRRQGYPCLGLEKELRASLANIVVVKMQEGMRIQLTGVLDCLHRGLEGDIRDEQQAFEIIQTEVTKAEILWCKAFLPQSEQNSYLGMNEAEQTELWELARKLNRENRLYIQPRVEKEDAQSVIALHLPDVNGVLLLGIAPEKFETELKLIASPWLAFLESLAETVDRVMFRLQNRAMDKVVADLEIQSIRAIVHSLWFHELGNIAARIDGSSKLAAQYIKANASQMVSPKLEIIQKETANFKKVAGSINRPLDYDENKTEFSLREVSQAVQENYEYLFQVKGIEYIQEIDLDLKINLPFPIAYLAIANLIANATHAIDREGKIHIQGLRDGRCVKCSVTDNGSGVSTEDVKLIFRKGFSTKKSSGFGLPGCKLALKKCGGDLYYDESYEGKGARFVILLPVKSSEVNNDQDAA